MPMGYGCPFFGKEADGVLSCEACRITFKSRECRRAFVYKYCADASGYRRCPMARQLIRKYEEEDHEGREKH
jgi:hypothetical protein